MFNSRPSPIERQIADKWLITAGYNSFLGRHVMAPYNINQAAPYDPADPLSLKDRRPYPFFSDILLQGNNGNSSYNGAFLNVGKSLANGLDLVASYTYSKSLDAFSSSSGGFENQDARNTHLDWGLSDFDVRHYLSVGYLWELPFGKNKPFVNQGVGAMLLGGWQLSGITQYRSGLPLNISMPTSWPNVASVFSAARPNRTCDGRLSNPTMNEYFDTSCFKAPAANSFGNSGRNIMTGPAAQFWDMSLERRFQFERASVEFRAESYSVFNVQNWNNPDTGTLDTNFGRIFGKNNPRRFQFGLRVQF